MVFLCYRKLGSGAFRELEFVERRAGIGFLARRGGRDFGLGLAQQLGRGAEFLGVDRAILRLGLQGCLEVAEFLRIDATDTHDGADTAGGTGLHAFSLADTLRRRRRDGLGALAALASGRGLLFHGLTALPRGRSGLFNRFTTLTSGLSGLFNGLAALTSGRGRLFDWFATLASGLGGLFDWFTALARGLSSLFNGLAALASGLGGLFDRLTPLARGRGRLFDRLAILTGRLGPLRHGLRTGGLSRLGNGLSALPHRLGGLLDGLTSLRSRLDGLGDGLRLLRHRLRRLGLRGIDGLYARGTPLFDAFDAFDVRRGGLLSRGGGAKKTGGEEQAVHWERWVRTDFWNSLSTRCSYSANAVSSWCSAR